jgi:hypothetical protein
MGEQVSNVEKYNRKLAEMQQFTEEFYASKKFKLFQRQILNIKQIDDLRAQIKLLKKDEPDFANRRSDIFKTLTTELLVVSISVVHLSRQYELLIYLSQLIFVREKPALYALMDQDCNEV